MSFNPRARVGRDQYVDGVIAYTSGFQSTRPRGARQAIVAKIIPYEACFNPRARVGRDLAYIKQAGAGSYVSIHAPAWGATDLMLAPFSA